MSGPDFYAARKDDFIEHSHTLTGLVTGVVAGAVIGVLTVSTGGAALVVVATVAGAAACGGGIGMALGSLSPTREKSGDIGSGSPNVIIGGSPAARAHDGGGDYTSCEGPPLFFWNPIKHGKKWIAQGSGTVLINGQPAARHRDKIQCSAVIGGGCTSVLLGGCTEQTMDLEGELPREIGWGLMAVGIASGLVLTSPMIVLCSIAGSTVLGTAGAYVAAQLFPGSEDAQILGGLTGSTLGGYLGGWGGEKGTQWLTGRGWFNRFASNHPRVASLLFSRGHYERMINGYMRNNLKPSDFVLQPGEKGAVWSGPGSERVAIENGKVVLRMTKGGQKIDAVFGPLEDVIPYDFQRPLFDEASRMYIEGMPDGITLEGYFVGKPKPGSTYIRIEKPTADAKNIKINENFVPGTPRPAAQSPKAPPIVVLGWKLYDPSTARMPCE